MKRTLDYYEMKKIILDKIPLLKTKNFDEVVVVSRGGITIGHIIAKELKLQVGILYPAKNEIAFFDPHCKNILIIEDLVAQGRTTKIIHKVMNKYAHKKYYYMPFLVDANYKVHDFHDSFMVSEDWIVFPWEENDSVVEGDRGLFRDKTDSYQGAPNDSI